MKDIKKSYLYDWVFRFNPYDDKWYATRRSNYNELFSNVSSNDVLRSSEVSTLVHIIKRTNGDKNKINQILNESKSN